MGNADDDRMENARKALEFADAWAKLISSLSTGTLVLSATFIKDLFPDAHAFALKKVLFASWSALGLAAALGLMVLGALVAELDGYKTGGRPSVFAGAIQFWAIAQFVMFALGVLLFAIFIGKNL